MSLIGEATTRCLAFVPNARRVLLSSSAVLLVIGMAAPAAAQVAADASGGDAGGTVEAVVVTGSQIARAGFTAPTPTTVLSATDLQRTGATNVENALNQLPEFRASSTNSVGTFNGSAGGNYLDLRGLGIVRTLTLVNGQRFVPSNLTGQLDMNLIPSIMIDRTEVVTGGASAAYGSDAVAGVVNLIYKNNFSGFQAEVSGGEDQRGDNQEVNVGALGGTDFAGGRGHITIGGQYVNNRGVGGIDTTVWGQRNAALIANPLTGPGQPTRLLTTNALSSNVTLGGLIVSPGSLKGTQFIGNGQTAPFVYGNPVGPSFMVGGGNAPGVAYQLIATPISRGSVSAHLSYDVTPDIQATADFSFGKESITSRGGRAVDTALVIQADNAYLPANVRNTLLASNLSSLTLGRREADISTDPGNPWFASSNESTMFRGVAGLNGKFGNGWTWDAYYEHGQTDNLLQQTNEVAANFQRAIDAVVDPSTGNVVCRATLSPSAAVRAAATGCAPFNVFGNFSRSNAAAAYVSGLQTNDMLFKEDVVSATVHGEPFSTWAGPVSVAVGGQYRSDSVDSHTDPISQANGFYSGNPKPIQGSTSDSEGFAETVVPLAKDMTLARLVEFNGAIRYTDYKLSGGATTWKVGLTYKPIDDLRFRFTRSHDIRAPNLSELYTTSLSTLMTLIDPTNGASNPINVVSGGNAALKPETSDTTTFGVVYEPSWVKGFRVSVDSYNINVTNAISTLAAQDIITRCVGGATNLCSLLTRDSTGKLVTVNTDYLNLASLHENGVDLELLYRLTLSDIYNPLRGQLTTRLFTTYVQKYTVNDGQTTVNIAGEVGGVRAGDLPHLTSTGVIEYDNGPLSLSTQIRYVGGGKYDALGTPQNINWNKVASRTYAQLSASYVVVDRGSRHLEVFGVVDNVFNLNPPLAPNANFSYTNTALYDMIGRTFTLGVRFKY